MTAQQQRQESEYDLGATSAEISSQSSKKSYVYDLGKPVPKGQEPRPSTAGPLKFWANPVPIDLGKPAPKEKEPRPSSAASLNFWANPAPNGTTSWDQSSKGGDDIISKTEEVSISKEYLA